MTYAGVEVKLHVFLTSALDGGEWSASHTDRFAARCPLDGRLGWSRASMDKTEGKKTSAPARDRIPVIHVVG
jgi:hypothetical protein